MSMKPDPQKVFINKYPGCVSCVVFHEGSRARTSVASADEIEQGVWWVSRVKVHDRHHREGHGKRLVAAMKAACAELGADVVQVIPGGYNVPVARQRAFYAACGFEPENENGLMVWRPDG